MMTATRAGLALLMIGLVCLAVVLIRTERRRLEARTQMHIAACLEHQREAWKLQLEIGRLRAPQQIRDRAERLGVPVAPPDERVVFLSESRKQIGALEN